MQRNVANSLASYIAAGWGVNSTNELNAWRTRLYSFLEGTYEDDLVSKLRSFESDLDVFENGWRDSRDRQVAYLEGQTVIFSSSTANEPAKPSAPQEESPARKYDLTRVFLVHGHDDAAKESVARFLERLDLTVVILHEQPNEGMTVIEKFEQHSTVGFAVVLLTPDDLGASAKNPDNLQPRARQNVVLELGYFTGKLGRERVCGLFRPGVEVPSDFHGVLLTELDAQGGWKTKLAQELVTASMKIDIQGLVRG